VAAEMDNLATKTSLSGDEAQKLADLRGEYDELAGKYRENADEHELATKRILFDLVQHRLPADGVISEDE